MSQFQYMKARATKGLGIYSELDKRDIIDRLLPTLSRGNYAVKSNGRIESNASSGVVFNSPWLHQTHAENLNCNLWHFFMFNHYQWFVPSQCQECWKVVVGPRSLSELWKLKDLQWKLGIPSKAGIEVREYTAKLYGGYFYNKGLYNGRKCYKAVREAVNDAISPDVPVLLKRACTEFEMAFPKSSTWQITDEQMEVEELLNDRVEESGNPSGQPDIIRTHIKRIWIHWAYSVADPTYKEFTDGKPLHPPYETYHDKTIEECEMMLNNGLASAEGFDVEKLNALSKDLVGAAATHGAGRMDAAMAMGLRDSVRLRFRDEFIGEHDELTAMPVKQEVKEDGDYLSKMDPSPH